LKGKAAGMSRFETKINRVWIRRGDEKKDYDLGCTSLVNKKHLEEGCTSISCQEEKGDEGPVGRVQLRTTRETPLPFSSPG